MFALSGASEFAVAGIWSSMDKLVNAVVACFGDDVRAMMPADMLDSCDAFEVDVSDCTLFNAHTDEECGPADEQDVIEAYRSTDQTVLVTIAGQVVRCYVM